MARSCTILPLALTILAAGCADPAAPAADPAKIERLVASMEAQPAGDNEAALPKSVEKKLQNADRVADTLIKVQPERIDPEVAAALIAR